MPFPMLRTLDDRVATALERAILARDWYLGIARTTTPWADENAPPAVDPTATSLQEVAGYKKLDQVVVCYPSPTGEIEFRFDSGNIERYAISSDSQAFANQAIFVYMKAELRYDEFPLVTYRQVGLVEGLTPSGADMLLPGDVTDPGRLRGLQNKPPVDRAIDQVNSLQYLWNF